MKPLHCLVEVKMDKLHIHLKIFICILMHIFFPMVISWYLYSRNLPGLIVAGLMFLWGSYPGWAVNAAMWPEIFKLKSKN